MYIWTCDIPWKISILISGTTIEEETEEDLCSSNHFILDRIAEKGSTHNLFRWVRGGQHSQPLQVGQGWAALTTSSGGPGVSQHLPFLFGG
jgi:hypothetical protein